MGYEPSCGLHLPRPVDGYFGPDVMVYVSLIGGSSGGALMCRAPTLFLDHTEDQRAEKDFFDTAPAAPLSQGVWMTAAPPPRPLSEGLDPPVSFHSSSRSVG